MFSKVKLEKSNEGVIAIDYSEPPPKPPEMIYMTETPEAQGPLLLLPEESCLAEDEKAVLELHCTRPGFHFFGLGDVTFKNVPVKVYLTNYRLFFVLRSSSQNQQSSFSICLEAIEDPHASLAMRSFTMIDFNVNLEHGREAAQRHPQTCKTVMEIVDNRSSSAPAFRNCRIRCTFQRPGKAKMFLKGINLVRAEGRACPTHECRFIGYEDLPVYNPVMKPPAFTESLSIC